MRRRSLSAGSAALAPQLDARAAQTHKKADIQYPSAAHRHQIEGVVVLGVRISYTGCVGGAETLRSVSPLLDFAAIQGVFDARYTPTLLDGQPIETYMTYTVNFRR